MFLTMFDIKHKKIWSPENTAPKNQKKMLQEVPKSRHCEMNQQRNKIFH